MASIDNQQSYAAQRGQPSRRKRHLIRIDMTPMVDLGFLLISFFVMTVSMNQPATLSLAMPKEGGPPSTLGESNALTLLVNGKGHIYYYHGDGEEALSTGAVYATTLDVKDGIGKIITEKQKALDQQMTSDGGRDGLMLLIKAGPDAPYGQVIAALDEALIHQVKRYALLGLNTGELTYIQKQKH